MRILGLLWKFMLLSGGLMLLVGGLVASILGLGTSVGGFAAAVGLTGATFGGLLVWVAMRQPARQGQTPEQATADTGR